MTGLYLPYPKNVAMFQKLMFFAAKNGHSSFVIFRPAIPSIFSRRFVSF